MTFSNSDILWFLAGIPLLVMLTVWAWRNRRKALNLFSDENLLAQTAPHMVSRRWLIRRILFISALALLVFALAGPRFGAVEKKSEKSVADIVIALAYKNIVLRPKHFYCIISASAIDSISIARNSCDIIACTRRNLTVPDGTFRPG